MTKECYKCHKKPKDGIINLVVGKKQVALCAGCWNAWFDARDAAVQLAFDKMFGK